MKPHAVGNMSERDLRAALRNAAMQGDSGTLKALIEPCARLYLNQNSSVQKEGDVSPLIFAAQNGHAACVELLLEACDPALADNYGRTALHMAVRNNRVESIKLLLPHSNIEARDAKGYTALTSAAEAGHVDSLRLLLDAGAEVNIVSGAFESTPLMLAAEAGSRACLDVLLPLCGDDVNKQNLTGDTALMLSMNSHTPAQHSLECVQRLLAKSDLSLVDSADRGVLQCAMDGKQVEVVSLLVHMHEQTGCPSVGRWELTRAMNLCSLLVRQSFEEDSKAFDILDVLLRLFPLEDSQDLTLWRESGRLPMAQARFERGALAQKDQSTSPSRANADETAPNPNRSGVGRRRL